MVEWNRIFRLFRFSGILDQPREVHPKFRNEIPENVCSIRSPTRNSGIFGRMESAPVLTGFYRVQRSNKNSRKKRAVNSLGHLIHLP